MVNTCITHKSVIGAVKNCTKKCKKSKLYCNTFHLPPLGLLCDYPEVSYCPLKKLTDNKQTEECTDNYKGAFNIDKLIT